MACHFNISHVIPIHVTRATPEQWISQLRRLRGLLFNLFGRSSSDDANDGDGRNKKTTPLLNLVINLQWVTNNGDLFRARSQYRELSGLKVIVMLQNVRTLFLMVIESMFVCLGCWPAILWAMRFYLSDRLVGQSTEIHLWRLRY